MSALFCNYTESTDSQVVFLFSTFHRVYPELGRQQLLNMYLLYWIITDVHNTKTQMLQIKKMSLGQKRELKLWSRE